MAVGFQRRRPHSEYSSCCLAAAVDPRVWPLEKVIYVPRPNVQCAKKIGRVNNNAMPCNKVAFGSEQHHNVHFLIKPEEGGG